MDFTREPIIETVITPKEGCKIVVRSSKSAGQEEYFVDAVEVVSFGNALFFRSLERPKAFLVPATDYEVLEVREARMVLKNVGLDRTIKIAGGREPAKPPREQPVAAPAEMAAVTAETSSQQPVEAPEAAGRVDKRREKRRQHRRRRGGREEGAPGEGAAPAPGAEVTEEGRPVESLAGTPAGTVGGAAAGQPPMFSSLLPPPPTLISETIARYRDNALFKDAFFEKEEDAEGVPAPFDTIDDAGMGAATPDHDEEALEMQKVTLEPSAYGTFEVDIEQGAETVDREEESDILDIRPENNRTDFPK